MAATWSVNRQAADQIDLATSGDPVSGVRIFFTTGLGQTGSVFVPDTQYHNTGVVKEAIQLQADQMDRIAQLKA